MSKPKYSTDDEILKCLEDGYNVVETIKKCRCSFLRVLKAEKELKAMGKKINKYGKFIDTSHKRKVRKEKNKMEYLDRSTKNNWKRYMAANPFYFQEAFRKEFSKETVIDAANEMFN